MKNNELAAAGNIQASLWCITKGASINRIGADVGIS